MAEFLYVPPYLNWSLFGTVTLDSGTVDPDHDLAWLVDGRPAFPLRLTDVGGAINIANAAGPVNIAAICHHLLDEGVDVVLGDDISGSLSAPAVPRNGVPLNFAKLITEVPGVTSVDLDITGGSPVNSSDLLIGEAMIGKYLVLDPPIRIAGSTFGERHYVHGRASDLSGIPGYSERARSRPMSGSQYYSQAMLEQILEWWDSQDGYAYPIPSLIIPNSDDLTDCRLVMLEEPTYTRVGPEDSDTEYLVDVSFVELPRTRW